MGDQAAYSQLLDMGIPGGRARAALRRSKGDVMSAAERVFAGEFDDIPSDNDEMDETHAADLPPPGDTSACPTTVNAVSRFRRFSQEDEDDDEIMLDGDSSSKGDDDEDLEGDFGDDELHEDQLLSDPYAGVFFSKERTEDIVEPVEKEVFVTVTLPHVPGTESRKGKSQRVRVLGRGEWMSGCPEGNEQSYLFQLYSMLAEENMSCSGGCGHVFHRNPSDFFSLFPDFKTYAAHLKSIIRPICPDCQRHTCLACGERVDRPPVTSSMHSSTLLLTTGAGKAQKWVAAPEELLHCPNLQGALIGVGLHMIEQAFSDGSKSASRPSPTCSNLSSPEQQKTLSLSSNGDELDAYDSDLDDWDSGFGRLKGAAKGTGYAGAAKEDRSGQLRAQQIQQEADKKTTSLLNQVSVFLPSFDRPGGARSSDHLVHPTALAHLRRRSAFVNELLRNDSLLDMSNRGDLYRALFDWLEIVSSHEALASMLAMPQMRPVKTKPSLDGADQVIVTYEGSSSPRELLESCVIQAQAALKSLHGFAVATQESKDEIVTEEDLRISMAEQARRDRVKKEEEQYDPNFQMRLFCERIVNSAQVIDRSLEETKGKPFVQRMKAVLPQPAGRDADVLHEHDPGMTDQEIIASYEKWATQARFQYCDMSVPSEGSSSDKINYYHAYNSSIQSLDGLDMAKRSLAIAKELAVLTTSLPVAWHSTIFLRIDEARVDVLKAMIIGPEGTPYENGCFVFDIFLPLGYNQHCPNVKSMTTNGGRFRYNPNLYADGKVCLSLLGTWSGPGWIAGQSTLLQVLISIQSLIFCEEPYLNEPGWADQAGSSASKAYSANVRRMTLIDALANNIKSPPRLFENEVKTHFRLKSRSIREQIKKWKSLDDGKDTQCDHYGSFVASNATGKLALPAFDKAAEGLLKLLDELEGQDSGLKQGKVSKADDGNGHMEENHRGKGKGKTKDGKKGKIAKILKL
ncbi:hypothetical protein I316_03843 [Kwoniella heveanensis BCC8398]|uniref:Ubiquitin-conjugating enzyme family protein n=1 Tax=Kwoniella heveanensis BCC8398 TaxID=1296120 RepID=A0A1B9GTD6_9TREE|nr:hypothetical protein I316_03843 [Kwoniella heveanensis BCC8398]